MSARFDGVIFDLDGTLVDTLTDIADALNHVLAAHGFARHGLDDYRHFIGAGVEQLVQRAVPQAGLEQRDAIIAEYRAYYALHMLDRSVPYPGIPELLAQLAAQRIPISVLSNKPDPATRSIIAALFPSVPFVDVVGQRPERPRKPDPTVALELVERMRIAPERCAFVGDSDFDMLTACAAGMFPVGVSWGFRGRAELAKNGARMLIEHPAELLDGVLHAGAERRRCSPLE
jgi:phosphoglycolate phosphatase